MVPYSSFIHLLNDFLFCHLLLITKVKKVKTKKQLFIPHIVDIGPNTLCLKKVYPLMFDINFGKCGLIFEILPPVDSQENYP